MKRFDAFDAVLFAALALGILALNAAVLAGGAWIVASIWRAVMS